jgi:hypothetical protein
MFAAERMGKILNSKGNVVIVAVSRARRLPKSKKALMRSAKFPDQDSRQALRHGPGGAVARSWKTCSRASIRRHVCVQRVEYDGRGQALRGRAGRVKLVGFDWAHAAG